MNKVAFKIDDMDCAEEVTVLRSEIGPLVGVVTKGFTHVNQAPITGESLPVYKSQGEEVFAGTISGDSAFEFRSTKPASDTTLSLIIHMVEDDGHSLVVMKGTYAASSASPTPSATML